MTQPLLLTVAELDECVEDILFLRAWANALEAEIQKALESGAIMQHAYLEAKRGLRRWDADEAVVQNRLTGVLEELGRDPSPDVVAPRKVISPSAAEKLVGKRAYEAHLASMVTSESTTGGYNLKLQK